MEIKSTNSISKKEKTILSVFLCLVFVCTSFFSIWWVYSNMSNKNNFVDATSTVTIQGMVDDLYLISENVLLIDYLLTVTDLTSDLVIFQAIYNNGGPTADGNNDYAIVPLTVTDGHQYKIQVNAQTGFEGEIKVNTYSYYHTNNLVFTPQNSTYAFKVTASLRSLGWYSDITIY